MTTPACILDGHFDLAESPVWSVAEQALWFVDINAPALHRYDPASAAHRHWSMPAAIGCIALDRDGGLIAALRNGLYRLDLTRGRHHLLAAAPYDAGLMRFNDGRCDRQGRLWAGTMTDDRRPHGALYRFDGRQFVRQELAGSIAISNGLAWSPDGRILYHADTPAMQVHAYDYDIATAELSNRRLFLDLRAVGERPDGATVDSAGNYWLALYGAGKVAQFSPAGERLREIHLPVKAPTMPCFGGPDLRTLFITTARQKHTPEELEKMPLAGGIFSLRVEIPGLPEAPFISA
ncbi:SMP-30/gluconolactonase/LRE family protein [Ferrovibrio sp.]|uniref:SMP-30/gluconolactonase/LRE family protein n=1 Tax=Ferrovibrio sp. TaxID=1917215 RepID=UPI0035B42EC5